MRRRSHALPLATAAVLTTAFSGIALAAIPIQSPEELKEGADAIVIGKVLEIRAKTDRDAEWENREGVVIVEIEKTEKGDKLKAGDKVEIAFWTQQWIGSGSPPPYGNGHDVPEVGAGVRAHLEAAEDGSFKALLPNGIVTLPKAKTKSAK